MKAFAHVETCSTINYCLICNNQNRKEPKCYPTQCSPLFAVSLFIVSVICGQLLSKNVKWKNSRKKQFLKLKLHAILSSVMESHGVQPQPTENINHHRSASVQATLIFLSNGSKVQELGGRQFRYAKEKLWSASFQWKSERCGLNKKKQSEQSICWDHMCSVALVMSNSLQPYRLWPTRLLCPWDSPGKKTGVDHHSLPQGIFLTRR